MRLVKFYIKRITSYEFWPYWVFYAPFLIQWLWYSFRSGSLLYFTRVNYGLPFGGFFESSKWLALKQLNSDFIPSTKFYDKINIHPSKEGFEYPFIIKRDYGERGDAVFFIKNEDDENNCLKSLKNSPFLAQSFVPYHIELGILFYKFPSGKKGISSIVRKGFLEITGDGKHTFEELILNNIRAYKRADYFKEQFKTRWNSVLNEGEKLLLEPIGNHSRGTTFWDSNELINDELVDIFDKIASPIQGFYYGRFDLKVESIEKLYKGECIKIVEVNGVNSEAAHIYDPSYSLLRAYKHVFINLGIVFQISKELRKLNKPIPSTFLEFCKALKTHTKRNKIAF